MGITFTSISLSSGTEDDPNTSARPIWEALLGTYDMFELPDHAYGPTGYLDGLQPEDLPEDMPVVAGIDRDGRCFISVRVLYDRTRVGVVTFFQRHPGNDLIWVPAGDPDFMPSNMTQQYYIRLTTLLQKGVVSWEKKTITGHTCEKTFALA